MKNSSNHINLIFGLVLILLISNQYMQFKTYTEIKSFRQYVTEYFEPPLPEEEGEHQEEYQEVYEDGLQ
jgi:hypothetical protein